MSYSIIAAIGNNNELGYKNDLIWHLKRDLKFFRSITNGKSIIMGRRTFESLPKMLPNRHHIVLSSSNDFPDEVSVYHRLEDLLEEYKNNPEELFVIGGASIYQEFLKLSDKMYLTEVDASFDKADVYFPVFNEDDYDMQILDFDKENNIEYKHVLYKRKIG